MLGDEASESDSNAKKANDIMQDNYEDKKLINSEMAHLVYESNSNDDNELRGDHSNLAQKEQDEALDEIYQDVELQDIESKLLVKGNTIETKIRGVKKLVERIARAEAQTELIPKVREWIMQHDILDFLNDDTHPQLLHRMLPILRFLYQNEDLQIQKITEIVLSGLNCHGKYLKVIQSFLGLLSVQHLCSIVNSLIAFDGIHACQNLAEILVTIIKSQSLFQVEQQGKKGKRRRKHKLERELPEPNIRSNSDLFDQILDEDNISIYEETEMEGEKPRLYFLRDLVTNLFIFLIESLPLDVEKYSVVLNKLVETQPTLLADLLASTIAEQLKMGKSQCLWVLEHCLKLGLIGVPQNSMVVPVEDDYGSQVRQVLTQKLASESLEALVISNLAKNRFDKQIVDQTLNVIVLLSRNMKPLSVKHTELLWKILGQVARDQAEREHFFILLKQSLIYESVFSEEAGYYIYINILMKLDCSWFTPFIIDCFEALFMRLNEDLKLLVSDKNHDYMLEDHQLIGLQKFWQVYFQAQPPDSDTAPSPGSDAVIKLCLDLLCGLTHFRTRNVGLRQKLLEDYVSTILRYMQNAKKEKAYILSRGFKIIQKLLTSPTAKSNNLTVPRNSQEVSTTNQGVPTNNRERVGPPNSKQELHPSLPSQRNHSNFQTQTGYLLLNLKLQTANSEQRKQINELQIHESQSAYSLVEKATQVINQFDQHSQARNYELQYRGQCFSELFLGSSQTKSQEEHRANDMDMTMTIKELGIKSGETLTVIDSSKQSSMYSQLLECFGGEVEPELLRRIAEISYNNSLEAVISELTEEGAIDAYRKQYIQFNLDKIDQQQSDKAYQQRVYDNALTKKLNKDHGHSDENSLNNQELLCQPPQFQDPSPQRQTQQPNISIFTQIMAKLANTQMLLQCAQILGLKCMNEWWPTLDRLLVPREMLLQAAKCLKQQSISQLFMELDGVDERKIIDCMYSTHMIKQYIQTDGHDDTSDLEYLWSSTTEWFSKILLKMNQVEQQGDNSKWILVLLQNAIDIYLALFRKLCNISPTNYTVLLDLEGLFTQLDQCRLDIYHEPLDLFHPLLKISNTTFIGSLCDPPQHVITSFTELLVSSVEIPHRKILKLLVLSLAFNRQHGDDNKNTVTQLVVQILLGKLQLIFATYGSYFNVFLIQLIVQEVHVRWDNSLQLSDHKVLSLIHELERIAMRENCSPELSDESSRSRRAHVPQLIYHNLLNIVNCYEVNVSEMIDSIMRLPSNASVAQFYWSIRYVQTWMDRHPESQETDLYRLGMWIFKDYLFQLEEPHAHVHDCKLRKLCYELLITVLSRSGQHDRKRQFVWQVIKMINEMCQDRMGLVDSLQAGDRSYQIRNVSSNPLAQISSYIGIRNLGATCYINSLLQQLYHTKFSKLLLEGDNEWSEQEAISSMECIAEPVNFNVLQSIDVALPYPHLKLRQLKVVFMELFCSMMKCVDAGPFVKSINFYGEPINPSVQQDATEFLLCLFDYIESQGYRSELYDVFGGNICNTIIAKPQGNDCDQFSSHQSESMIVKKQVEHFYSLTIDIKGKKNLDEALAYFIKPQTLDGDNSYFCEELGYKTRATKCTLIKDMPNILILTLKRFEFDYESQIRHKLNDYFEFPLQLDLMQYSEDYQGPRQQPSASSREQSNYQLVGVLIHSGSAESGHYYSFTKIGEKWLQFNDSVVSEFNIQENLKRQCFGCAENKKTRSAYILFYEKMGTGYHGVHVGSIPARNPARHIVNSRNRQLLKEQFIAEPEFVRLIGHSIAQASNIKETAIEDEIVKALQVVDRIRATHQYSRSPTHNNWSNHGPQLQEIHSQDYTDPKAKDFIHPQFYDKNQEDPELEELQQSQLP